MSSTSIFPSTVDRVPDNTACEYNERIRQQTEQRVAHYARQGRAAIDQRLIELDQEWDIERRLETNAASAVIVGSMLGFFVDRRFILLPMAVGGFLLQHAMQGWCPPLPIFRAMGVRTQAEIEEERYALKALRGDFAQASSGGQVGGRSPREAVSAVRR
jgi:F0F1-type ATP synthase assembly protein I